MPDGIDDMLETWFGAGGPPEPDVLSALVAVVDRRRHGEGLSRLLLEAMRDLARGAGFSSLIAPVRPTLVPAGRLPRRARALRGAERLDAAPRLKLLGGFVSVRGTTIYPPEGGMRGLASGDHDPW